MPNSVDKLAGTAYKKCIKEGSGNLGALLIPPNTGSKVDFIFNRAEGITSETSVKSVILN